MELRAFGSPVKILKTRGIRARDGGVARTDSVRAGVLKRRLASMYRRYLQNGQLPVPLSFVAAAAVVANSANAAAVSANSFDFIDHSFRCRSGPSATVFTIDVEADLKVKLDLLLDLQAELKVCNEQDGCTTYRRRRSAGWSVRGDGPLLRRDRPPHRSF